MCNLKALGERQIILDCDVLQADGGTRTAAITGAFVALHDACVCLVVEGVLSAVPLLDSVGAVSVGLVDGVAMVDLDYEEDARAGVDMNVVMTGSGLFVEVQGTAERDPFPPTTLDELLELAGAGIRSLLACDEVMLATPPSPRIAG